MKKKQEKILSVYESKLMELVEAGKKAFDLLVKEVERPIDEELQDDRARNAMKAKKECFMDAKEIMSEVQKLEAQLRGEEEEILITQEVKDSVYTGGYAEQFAKNKK
jgi:hypothetical protein|tara:strand:+ start:137 stop:457 length:321 start_codon:yes stop_codon:yes gene_type:complete